ncbi:MAG TPA: ribonuclease R [Dongiaceae bacterium]|nr:ribonuclease R [Dongiaceae bacterium]
MTDDARRFRQALLDLMRRPEYRPAEFHDLERLLKVDRARHRTFKRVVGALTEEGVIERTDRRRFALTGAARPGGTERPAGARGRGAGPVPTAGRAAPARPGAPAITGLLQVNPKGFGFVVADQGGRDLFIPPQGVGNWRDGDRVSAIVVQESRDGRLQGEITGLIERSRRRVVGVFRAARGGASAAPAGQAPAPRGAAGVVEAYDRRHEGGVVIPEGQAGGAVDGLVVGVEILTPPTEARRATGRVIEVIGPEATAGTELRAVIVKFGLREEFPPDVLQEAERAPAEVSAAERAGREDFRGLPIVTIDGETARDFDDAVLVRRLGDGWELQVHIADVGHYVQATKPLDAEALERGTSVYFPGFSLPMLPHRLSNGICSLNPKVDRLVLSCVMTLDAEGQITAHRLVEGVIRSAARMTYTEVAKILVGRDPAVIERYRDLVPHFQAMETLCGVLNARRRKRGSIDFDLPEPEVILAATGEMTGILALERNIAHRIIEEFMLAANETVAEHLFKARVPSIYRVHERPDPRRLEDFDIIAHAFGYRLPRPFTAIQPAAFAALLDRARGRPEEPFLAKQMLRSMKQARYSERRDQHFGLASPCYTHFTSPIRRYPDLIVHRLVKRLLKGTPMDAAERARWEEFLPEAAARSSFRERAADAAENELIQRKKMTFMAGRLGEEFDGFVGSVEDFGFFVELKELFVEGLVPIESLGDDRYRYDERRRVLRGERRGRVIALGDPARVRIARVDTARLQIEFALIGIKTGLRPAGALAPPTPDPSTARRRGSRRGGAHGAPPARGGQGRRKGSGAGGSGGSRAPGSARAAGADRRARRRSRRRR